MTTASATQTQTRLISDWLTGVLAILTMVLVLFSAAVAIYFWIEGVFAVLPVQLVRA